MNPWDPFRSLDMLTSLWSSTGWPTAGTGAAAPYKSMFTTLQRLLVGRQVKVRVDGHDVALTVAELDSPLDPRGLAVGQLGEVRLAARDIRWDGYVIDRADAVLHNLHIRPGVPPLLVAAPVELNATLPAEVVDDLLHRTAPQLRGELGGDGHARLHWVRRPALGSVEVDVAMAGPTLWLKPKALVTRRRRWSLPGRVPAYPVRLPELPRGLLVTRAEVGSNALDLSGILPEWRIELPLKKLEDIITDLSQRAGALSLTWPSLRRSSRKTAWEAP